MIPTLTEEKYLETDFKHVINGLTNRIKQLTVSFPKDIIHLLSEEEENKELKH
ncbi:MAG: hypothetical protein CM1200mP5_5360 [Candidatus Pelagibacterales bacterium]|nr:MAG: hypothetical protein CM1200mP5_5360 [Pelagibacterales bacterium]